MKCIQIPGPCPLRTEGGTHFVIFVDLFTFLDTVSGFYFIPPAKK